MSKKPIVTPDGVTMIEITQRCYCRCPWCYKCSKVGPHRPHVDTNVLTQRILWIAENIDCSAIYLIGGEPLLHPDLRFLVDLIITLGKRAYIITSGQISSLPHEQANYNFVLDYYERDLIGIELSYQPGRNDKAYTRMVADIQQRYENRRLAKIEKGVYYESSFDLFTTVVLPESVLDSFSTFLDFVSHAMTLLFGEGPNSSEREKYKESYKSFKQHYAPFEESASNSTSVSSSDKTKTFRAKIRFSGQIYILEDGSGQTSVIKPKDGPCTAMQVVKKDGQLIIQGTIVRDDGDLFFRTPECISATRGLCNAGIHTDHDTVYRVVLNSLRRIKYENILYYKRLSANSPAGYCQADKEYQQGPEGTKSCTSCPFDLSCNACHLPSEGWE